MKAVAIMNFPEVGQPVMFYVQLVVTFTCLCCFNAAEAEDCYRGSDLLDYANPCSDQPGQPARYDLCPKGQKLEERCTERCDYCSEGTYQDAFTNCTTCLDCITAEDCPRGQVIVKNCTRNTDAVCGCPPSPPCPSCPTCPPVTPCPSITPCPIQTECPACECPTDVPVTTDHQEPSFLVLTRECPADILAVAASGSKVTSVEWEEPQATEGAIILQSHHPGDSFVVGNITVIYVFRLGSQVENCSFGVTVVEEPAPHTTPPGTVEPSDGNISDSGPLVDFGTDYHKILLIISGALNLIFIVVPCLTVWKTGRWKDLRRCLCPVLKNSEGIELGGTGARTEHNDLRGAEGGNTGYSVASNTGNTRGGDRLASTFENPPLSQTAVIPMPVAMRSHLKVTCLTLVNRLTSTDQPPDIEGLISADPPPASANFNSDVANHSGDAVYGHNGGDDATDSTIPLLMPQSSSSTVPDHNFRHILETTQTITKSGGTLEIPNTGVVLIVPPNALPNNMQHCKMHLRIIPSQNIKEPVTSFSSNSSTVVELLPNGLKFKIPVRLTLPHCLVLKEKTERKARIFSSHHTIGRPPKWEEQTHLSYHLEDTVCIMLLDRFCFVKYSINDEIVEAKKLVVYTAMRKLLPQDRVAEVHAGYYFDLPGEKEVVQGTRDLIITHRKTLYFLKRNEQSTLKVSLDNIFPREWMYSSKKRRSQEISYAHIIDNPTTSLIFGLVANNSGVGKPLCVFTISQKDEIAVQLSAYLKVLDNDPSPLEITDQSKMCEETITKKGGTLKIGDTGVTLHIPPNALPAHMNECRISMSIIASRIIEDQVTSLCSNSSTAVELCPSDLPLLQPATLSLPHCLTFKENVERRARIFINNERGSPSPWKEQMQMAYKVTDNACEIQLDRLCCVKYSIHNNIVKAKNIKVYTASKEVNEKDELAEIELGYHSDIPGGGELLQLNPSMKLDSRRLFLLKGEQKLPLKLSLENILPPESQWKCCIPQPKGKQQEIPFKLLASSIEHSHLYILQKKQGQPGSCICQFEALQEGDQTPLSISLRVHPLYLSKNLTTKGKDVGVKLQLPDAVLDNINAGFRSMEGKAREMLKQWKQTMGKKATHIVLIKALGDAGRKDLADDIREGKDRKQNGQEPARNVALAEGGSGDNKDSDIDSEKNPPGSSANDRQATVKQQDYDQAEQDGTQQSSRTDKSSGLFVALPPEPCSSLTPYELEPSSSSQTDDTQQSSRTDKSSGLFVALPPEPCSSLIPSELEPSSSSQTDLTTDISQQPHQQSAGATSLPPYENVVKSSLKNQKPSLKNPVIEVTEQDLEWISETFGSSHFYEKKDTFIRRMIGYGPQSEIEENLGNTDRTTRLFKFLKQGWLDVAPSRKRSDLAAKLREFNESLEDQFIKYCNDKDECS